MWNQPRPWTTLHIWTHNSLAVIPYLILVVPLEQFCPWSTCRWEPVHSILMPALRGWNDRETPMYSLVLAHPQLLDQAAADKCQMRIKTFKLCTSNKCYSDLHAHVGILCYPDIGTQSDTATLLELRRTPWLRHKMECQSHVAESKIWHGNEGKWRV